MVRSSPTESQPPQFSSAEIRAVIAGLMLAMFLAALDQTIVATALPTIAVDLHSWNLVSWVISSYLITSTVTTPIYGRLSDLYGRKLTLLVSITVFVGASVLSAISSTMVELVCARALQGIGGGGLRSISQAVIADLISPRDRGRYQGYIAGAVAVANALGPLLGGLLSQYASWHWIFWINIPLGVAAFAFCNRQLARLTPSRSRVRVDWGGAILILTSATLILLSLASAQRSGRWLSLETIALAAGGFLFIPILVRYEWGIDIPMLPLRLFCHREFSVSCLILFLSTGVATALVVVIPLEYQLVSNLLPDDAGLKLIPFSVGIVAGSLGIGQIIAHTGRYRIFPIVANTSAVLLCLAMGRFGLGQASAFDIATTAALGIMLGCNFSPMMVAAQNTLNSDDNGAGMATVLFLRLMGGALIVALLTTILMANLDSPPVAMLAGHWTALGQNHGDFTHVIGLATNTTSRVADTVSGRFAHVYMVCAFIMLVALVASLFIKEVPLRKSTARAIRTGDDIDFGSI